MGYQVKPYFVARRVDFRQRDSLAPLPEYLMSRSVAGSTHEDLIRGQFETDRVFPPVFEYGRKIIHQGERFLTFIAKCAILQNSTVLSFFNYQILANSP